MYFPAQIYIKNLYSSQNLSKNTESTLKKLPFIAKNTIFAPYFLLKPVNHTIHEQIDRYY